jgi:acyl carrier protein
MHSHEEVLDRIRSTLVELFELSSEDITPEARLYEDLEIDSIDVIDLMDEMHRRTGRKATPEDFVRCARSAILSRRCGGS